MSDSEISQSEVELDREADLAITLDNFGGIEELTRRFGRGTPGIGETLDRSYIAMEFFNDYVLENPGTCLHPEIYKLSHDIAGQMADLYILIGQYTFTDEELNDGNAGT